MGLNTVWYGDWLLINWKNNWKNDTTLEKNNGMYGMNTELLGDAK